MDSTSGAIIPTVVCYLHRSGPQHAGYRPEGTSSQISGSIRLEIKVPNKCNALESAPNHPHPPAMEKLSFTKLVPSAKKGGVRREDLDRSLLFFLCVLFLFPCEIELGVSRPLGALHRVFKEGRCASQLLLHLLCTVEHPNCSETHSPNHCQCVLHHQGQQKQTSGKRFLGCPVPFRETSMRTDFACQGH